MDKRKNKTELKHTFFVTNRGGVLHIKPSILAKVAYGIAQFSTRLEAENFIKTFRT